MSKSGIVSLTLVIIFSFCTGWLFKINQEKAKALKAQQNFEIGERQLLQMVVNVTRPFNAGDTLFDKITVYYPDDDLDTSVYSYGYGDIYKDSKLICWSNKKCVAVARAKDPSKVPESKDIIAYYIASGLPVKGR